MEGMWRIIFLISWLLLGSAQAAVCKGETPCKACKDCSACRYCDPNNGEGGGSCGTCRPQDTATRVAAAKKRKGRAKRFLPN